MSLSSRGREWIGLGLILLAALWIHRGALRAPFFTDDYLFLDAVAGRSFGEAITAPDPIGNYFRPLGRQAWFWTWSALSGASPGAFHAANLALFLVAIALLHSIARRAAGPWAALIAASVLALQHAADVPVLWASGSQDLLALVFALATLRLVQAGQAEWAALPFLLGLLSKETVALTPVVAVVLGRRPAEGWRPAALRVWPLLAALLVWGAGVWALAARKPLLGLEASPSPADFLSVPLHLLQTVAGIEWGIRSPIVRASPPLAALLVLGALVWLAGAFPMKRDGERTEGRPPWIGGVVWALAGAIPVVMAARIWSAYYFLFAASGAALALGAFLARRPRWAGIGLVALLGWTGENARRLPEFARERDPWTSLSHVNRHYLERGMTTGARYLEDLRAARPALPPSTTLFFSGIPSQVGFQSGDGPLVRWAYRDSSLRSYFLTEFRLAHARRGPVFFFQARADSLQEVQGADSLDRIAEGLVLSGSPEAARDVWTLAWENDSRPGAIPYRLGIVELQLGRPDAARLWFERAGARPDPGPAPETAAASTRLAAGDTVAAMALAVQGVSRHALDGGAHSVLADLLFLREGITTTMTFEALAARALNPREASAWRRWAIITFQRERYGEAREALERYFALAGPAGQQDAAARRALDEVRRRLPRRDPSQEDVPAGPGGD